MSAVFFNFYINIVLIFHSCFTRTISPKKDLILKNMNESINPCDDFYEYACGNFDENHAIPPHKFAFNAFNAREEKIDQTLIRYLNGNWDDKNSSALQKMQHFFYSCLNDEYRELYEDFVIPVALTAVGLPLKPPFFERKIKKFKFDSIIGSMEKYGIGELIRSHIIVETHADAPSFFIKTKKFKRLRPVRYSFLSEFQSADQEDKLNSSEESEDVKKEEEDAEYQNTIVTIVKYMENVINMDVSQADLKIIRKKLRGIINFFEKYEQIYIAIENDDRKKQMLTATQKTLKQLQTETDLILRGSSIQFSWKEYIDALFDGAGGSVEFITIHNYAFAIFNFEGLLDLFRLFANTSRELILGILWTMTVESVSAFLPYATQPEYSEENYLPPLRIHECLTEIKHYFRHLIGHLLTREEFTIENKIKTENMIENIRRSFEDSINSASWLEAGTRMAALSKLFFIKKFVSYQEWMAVYKNVESTYKRFYVSRSSFFATSFVYQFNMMKLNLKYGMQRIKGNRNPNWMFLNPSIVNAAYNPTYNAINIPIAILGPPFQGHEIEAINYGAIGQIIGHELVHGFDINGKNFNSWGDFVNWWRKKTQAHFYEKTMCFVHQYDNIYFSNVNANVSGIQTLSENIADNGGLNLAFKAYQKYVRKADYKSHLSYFSHFTPEKLFTLGYANMCCERRTEGNLLHVLRNDMHAPGKARVNGVMMNFPDFAKIWGCKEGSNMNPSRKCSLW